MVKFPADVSKAKTIKIFESLGFQIIREREHISMIGKNPDGSTTPLTMPNHRHLKSSTLQTICKQAGIRREEFLQAFLKT